MSHLHLVTDDGGRPELPTPNETERCRACGAHVGKDQQFCAPGASWYPAGANLSAVESFCEKAYWSRVDKGMPVAQFLTWAEHLEYLNEQCGWGEPDGGTGICAGPDCNEPVVAPRRYHNEACRARAYRRRKQGGE